MGGGQGRRWQQQRVGQMESPPTSPAVSSAGRSARARTCTYAAHHPCMLCTFGPGPLTRPVGRNWPSQRGVQMSTNSEGSAGGPATAPSGLLRLLHLLQGGIRGQASVSYAKSRCAVLDDGQRAALRSSWHPALAHRYTPMHSFPHVIPPPSLAPGTTRSAPSPRLATPRHAAPSPSLLHPSHPAPPPPTPAPYGTHSPARAARMASMPSSDCRCTEESGPLMGKAVLDSSAQICSNRFSRSILWAGRGRGRCVS